MSRVLTDEKTMAKRWMAKWLFVGFIFALVTLILGWPLTDFVEGLRAGRAPAEWWVRTERFFWMLANMPQRVLKLYQDWGDRSMRMFGHPPGMWLAAVVWILAAGMEGLRWCPYDWSESLHGNSRPATRRDLKRWARARVVPYFIWVAARRSVNLLDNSGMILGRFEGRYVRCADTLSGLVLARPGSGKTTGIALPTMLADGMEQWSIFLFDIKGELYDLTAGWRAKCGPIFRFEPMGRGGARWNPLSPTKSLPKGQRYVEAVAELDAELARIYAPNVAGETPDVTGRIARIRLLQLMRDHSDWREKLDRDPTVVGQLLATVDAVAVRKVLSSQVSDLAIEVTHISSGIEAYLWQLASDMIPTPKDSGGNAKHFADTGREALFGLFGFTVFRSLRIGVEPNIGRCVDWWTGDAAEKRAAASDSQKEDDDAVGLMLDDWIDECEGLGYPIRYKQALFNLRSKPSKERGSIISTADTALNVFKQATVRDATSTSDFALDDIRGLKAADGKEYPVTIYVVVSLEQMNAMAPILTMLTGALQQRLISQPASFAKKARKVLFLLDEFAQIHQMPILLKGPAVGRGQRVSNLLIAQSDGQIEDTYGQAGLKILYDTSEYKVGFSFTTRQTAENWSTMMGKRTVQQRSISRKSSMDFSGLFDGLMGKQGGDPGGASYSDSLTGVPLFDVSDLMSTDDGAKIRPDEHIILVGARHNRPLVVKTPYYFNDRNLEARAQVPAPAGLEARGFCGGLAGIKPAETAKAAAANDNKSGGWWPWGKSRKKKAAEAHEVARVDAAQRLAAQFGADEVKDDGKPSQAA